MTINKLKQKAITLFTSMIPQADPMVEEIKKFSQLLFDRLSLNLLLKLSPQDFEKIMAVIWKNFWKPLSDQATVSITQEFVSFHKAPCLFLSLISKDRPYIIDSLQAFLARWNLTPQILLHPVVGVERNTLGEPIKIYLNYHEVKAQGEGGSFESVIFMMAKHKLSETELENFEGQLKQMLQQLYWVSDDQLALRGNLKDIESQLNKEKRSQAYLDKSTDTPEFLGWLQSKYFLPLGGRYFHLKASETNKTFFCLEKGEKVKLTGLFKDDLIASADDLVPAIGRSRIEEEGSPQSLFPLVSVLKTSHRSPVYRHSRIDSIELLDWSQEGKIQGVYQFIGIFKKELFNISAFDIPWLQRKAEAVFRQFNLDSSWHDGKTLISIIDSIPRDEMFYHSHEQLVHICHRVLELYEQPGDIAVFTRHDLYGRYLTLMLYLPRERYSFNLKERLGQIICNYLKGEIASSVAQIGDLPHARLIYVLNFTTPPHVKGDIPGLESALLEASLSWSDRFDRSIDQEFLEEISPQILTSYRESFCDVYQNHFSVEEAFCDIFVLESLIAARRVDLRVYHSPAQHLKAKIYHLGDRLSLATLLPILSHLGIRVLSETTYRLQRIESIFHIHDFEIQVDTPTDWVKNHTDLRLVFQDVWAGNTENDGFNQLVLKSGLTGRQVTLLRAYSKYLLQLKFPYSQGYIEASLAEHAPLTTLLIDYFELKFQVNREKLRLLESIENDFFEKLQGVTRLDHDKIFRRFLNVIQATVRTNYFQKELKGNHKDYISFKFICQKLEELPQPHPLYEIYVYSSRMEAIHLRGGKVARGGIRWSDRYEDYRTEVLGLMKAQMTKNSVIVPLGSKGGFIVKRQHELIHQGTLQEEVSYCYQMMIRGLLDITDNLVRGTVVSPPQVICYDDDDPYLVVAADKGTATFSDMANALSQEYGFWLDDAFASGGSAGYDHKKMAITSRGAWESVKRHFRERGHDVQTTPFTVIGVGDMSGDVFGNGMLCSEKIHLLAAFDHRHIFIDPNPDEKIAFQERKRLFELPCSSWADYDRTLISPGGGVYARAEKSIELSPQAQAVFGFRQAHSSPDDLIKALLRYQSDLLWFGGIGTFIKASCESDIEVGDIANQNIRIDAKTISAHVIGEGANLAMTQLARIEYALGGGQINTDAIDNSAGVDCSDHEVNIKILFNALPNKIDRVTRNEILREMTHEVAHLVLQDNYRQTFILSILQARDENIPNTYQSLMKILEAEVNLERTIEFLPDDEQIERRWAKNQGFTRPELAILLAYSKIHLYNQLLQSNHLNKEIYIPFLRGYFPTYLQTHFESGILAHPLRREITATVLVNELINQVGPSFIYEIYPAMGVEIHQVVEAFFTAMHLFKLRDLWSSIDALDDKMINSLQIKAYQQIAQALRMAVLHLLESEDCLPNSQGIDYLRQNYLVFLSSNQVQEMHSRIKIFEDQGIDSLVAEQLACVLFLPAILGITTVGQGQDDLLFTAKTYFKIQSLFGIDELEKRVNQLCVIADWQRSAQLRLLNDLGKASLSLVKQALIESKKGKFLQWIEENKTRIDQVRSLMTNTRGSRPDLGLLSFIIRQLQ